MSAKFSYFIDTTLKFQIKDTAQKVNNMWKEWKEARVPFSQPMIMKDPLMIVSLAFEAPTMHGRLQYWATTAPWEIELPKTLTTPTMQWVIQAPTNASCTGQKDITSLCSFGPVYIFYIRVQAENKNTPSTFWHGMDPKNDLAAFLFMSVTVFAYPPGL